MQKKSKFPSKKADTSHIIKPRVVHEWSDYQKAIFDNMKNGSGNTAIIARAGASKTTSLVESLRYLPRNKKTLVVAFNKSIADELKTRVPDTIDCMTLHSLGFRAVKLKFGNNVSLDTNKCFNIVKNIVDDSNNYDLIMDVCKVVSFCKSSLIDIPSQISDLMDKHDIDPTPIDRVIFISYVCQALRKCKEQTTIVDYDDMIYFPFVYGLNVGKWDNILIDECQDLNKSQLIMALSAAKPNSRIFAFLDPEQAIYGFRCADIESVNYIIDKLNPTKLSLPISYRCPSSVIKMVNPLVPDIKSAPNAKAGEIHHIVPNDMMNKVKPGDFILSRTNAPLIKYCMALLRQMIPANIRGRDVGANLLYFVKKSKAKTIPKFLEYVKKWQELEVERLLAEKKPIDGCLDKAECFSNLCENATTIDELKKTIEKLFNDIDDTKKVVLSTTHKSKGDERENVFVLRDSFRIWVYANTDISNLKDPKLKEEYNVVYVALTRAKDKLYIVSNKNAPTILDTPDKKI